MATKVKKPPSEQALARNGLRAILKSECSESKANFCAWVDRNPHLAKKFSDFATSEGAFDHLAAIMPKKCEQFREAGLAKMTSLELVPHPSSDLPELLVKLPASVTPETRAAMRASGLRGTRGSAGTEYRGYAELSTVENLVREAHGGLAVLPSLAVEPDVSIDVAAVAGDEATPLVTAEPNVEKAVTENGSDAMGLEAGHTAQQVEVIESAPGEVKAPASNEAADATRHLDDVEREERGSTMADPGVGSMVSTPVENNRTMTQEPTGPKRPPPPPRLQIGPRQQADRDATRSLEPASQT